MTPCHSPGGPLRFGPAGTAFLASAHKMAAEPFQRQLSKYPGMQGGNNGVTFLGTAGSIDPHSHVCSSRLGARKQNGQVEAAVTEGSTEHPQQEDEEKAQGSLVCEVVGEQGQPGQRPLEGVAMVQAVVGREES